MRMMNRLMAVLAMCVPAVWVSAAEIHVAPGGDDANAGTAASPLRSFAAAQGAARKLAGKEPVTVWFHGGMHYLPETIRITAEDSGTKESPVIYAAAAGEKAIVSGGMKLDLNWEPHKDGIVKAKTPAGLAMDQLFVDGKRLHMARYPNYDPKVPHFNGHAADAISPARTARWADPAGGYIHAMHNALWGDMHWIIRGKKADGTLDYEGGWQNNRPSAMHRNFRFVENIVEELDAPGEWFHDAKQGVLYLYPEAGTDLKTATIEVVRLAHLIELNGTKERPVRHVTLRGLVFRHAARTFMDNKEPLLRSDWTVYRGGAVVFNGAEDCAVEDSEFDQVGGNTIFVNNYNRRITVRGCLIRESGANGVAFVGDPKAVRSPIFRYGPQNYEKLDRTPGPIGDNFPADCLVEDCLITRTGRFEKQTAPIQISMAQSITVRHCSIYDVPRAGINISEGTWGGHVIEHCDVFDTVLETGDHGSFNSWGRDRFWDPSIKEGDKQVAADPALPLLDVVKPIILRNNRWRCDHGWDVDLDDGSTNYIITNNLMLNGGLKLREGFARTVTGNITVNNGLHPHCWYEKSGDVVTGNIFMGPYRPAGGMPPGQWGKEVDRNLFTTSDRDRMRFAGNECDANSVVADAMFIDPAAGDFRVKEGSPALKLGFTNFPMDRFGVRKAELRAMARTPVIPPLRSAGPAMRDPVYAWMGASVKNLSGQEFSAVGVSADAGGVLVTAVPAGSAAATAGLMVNDLIQSVDGQAVKGVEDLGKRLTALKAGRARLGIRRNQAEAAVEVAVPAEGPVLRM